MLGLPGCSHAIILYTFEPPAHGLTPAGTLSGKPNQAWLINPMQYVNLGRSNLKISRLGLGAMGIGDKSWRSWVLDQEESLPILKRALDLGINFIDTCDYYSTGRSEEVLGRFMRSFVRREEIVLATKVGNPMGKGANAKGYSRKHLHEAVDQSLRRLQTDYIDLYQTHIWDPSTQIEEMVDAFDALVRSGKVSMSESPTCRSGSWPKPITMPLTRAAPASSACKTTTIRSGERTSASYCRSVGPRVSASSPTVRWRAGSSPVPGRRNSIRTHGTASQR